MKPVIAIVGRPNVGKSALFNRLTTSRDALVVDRPGVTRDRQYGDFQHDGRTFLVVDTGGIGEADHDSASVAELMTEQSMLAANEASILIWVVDGRTGLTAVDESLALELRKLDKPVFLAVNKLEGHDTDLAISEFSSLGFDRLLAISAKRGDNVTQLIEEIAKLSPDVEEVEQELSDSLTISVLGRPNVGKSTLINRMIGEERMLAFDHPGTTRDSVRVPLEKQGRHYTLIDTAGVRKKRKVHDVVEKFSILKSFAAIEAATIILLVLDATEGVTDQDSSLLGLIEDSGKSVIIVINKLDGMQASDKKNVEKQLQRKFAFIDYAVHHNISALHGTGVGDIFKSINKIDKSLQIDASSSDITRILEYAVNKNPPQLVQGRRIKLRYAHIGQKNPIRIIIHGNQVDKVPEAYRRYLQKIFRQQLKLFGTNVLVEFKGGDNPFKGKKNQLTQRQINKRKRLMKFVKK